MGDSDDLNPMVRAECAGCGKPWVSTQEAFEGFPRCPFCGAGEVEAERIRLIEKREDEE